MGLSDIQPMDWYHASLILTAVAMAWRSTGDLGCRFIDVIHREREASDGG